MIYSKEVDNMCVVAKGPNHGPAPIPEEGKWIQAKEIKDISGYPLGGFVFRQENFSGEAAVTKMMSSLQSFSQERLGVNLFLAIDEEGGV